VLVYVIIDTPHVAQQAHSTYASKVFRKIMVEILPYLNVFPEVDYDEVPAEFGGQLPEQEGITDNTDPLLPTESAEAKVYETEEYVDLEEGQDSGIPDHLPGRDAAAESSSAEVIIDWLAEESATTSRQQTTEAETTKRQTQAATTAAETTKRQTQAATTAAETTKRQTQAETTTARATAEAAPEPAQQEASEGNQPGQIPIVEPNPG